MLSAGEESAAHKGELGESFDNFESGSRGLPVGMDDHERDIGVLAGLFAEGLIDLEFVVGHDSLGDSEVFFDDAGVLEDKRGTALMARCFYGYKHAACLAVDAVGEFWNDVFFRVIEVAVAQVKRVYERVEEVAARWVDDDIRLFVDDDEKVVFIDDIERDFADAICRFRGRREGQAHFLECLDAIGAVNAPAVGGNLSCFDELLDSVARSVAEPGLEELVQAHSGLAGEYYICLGLLRNDEFVRRMRFRPLLRP